MRKPSGRSLPCPKCLTPVLVQVGVPSGVDNVVFATGFRSGGDHRQLVGFSRVAPQAVHVIVENHRASRIVLVRPLAACAPVSRQRFNCLAEPAAHASHSYWNRLIGFSRLQIFPRRRVQIVGPAEIGVNVVGIIVAGRNIGDLPMPGAVMFDLPKPDQSKLCVLSHCHRQVPFTGPTADASRLCFRPTGAFVFDETHF